MNSIRLAPLNRRVVMRGLALSVLSLVLAGCFSDDNDDLKAWMSQSKESLRGKVEPLPEARLYQPFSYNAFDVSDPYNPHKMDVARKAGGGLAPDTNRPKEVLESYDLEKLTFVGTLQQGKIIQALIRAPDNNLYRIKVGNYMGQNFGKVLAVTDTEVKLKEIIEDSGGDWVERDTSLPLQEAEQKK